MKPIIVLESAKARARQEAYQQKLVGLHQSGKPPPELLRPVPRHLRWKRWVKVTLSINIALAVMALIGGGYLAVQMNTLIRGINDDIQKSNQRLRQRADQTTDSDKRVRLEKAIHDGEALERKWRLVSVLWIASLVFSTVLVPLGHLLGTWYVHIRPGGQLLRQGAVARATITARRRWWLILPSVEFGFTAENGEHIRRKQFLSEKESSLFTAGDFVWVLYLPARPKLAHLYGLKSAPAEIQVD